MVVTVLFSLVLEQKLAYDEFATLHPDDSEAATQAFVSFTGMFGQVCMHMILAIATQN